MGQTLDYIWDYRTGRDIEGDLFSQAAYTHNSGRIVAKIHIPTPGTDEYTYRVYWCVHIPKETLDTDDDWYFIDLESAQRIVEDLFTNFNPFQIKTLNVTPDIISKSAPLPNQAPPHDHLLGSNQTGPAESLQTYPTE